MEEYYYLNTDNQRIGPFTLEQLIAQHITRHTLIWKAGLAQWTNASEVPEVATLLGTQQTVPEPPQPMQYNRQNHICPPTNLVWGVLVTVFCCLPLGIIAIYKSSQVERYYYNGEYEKASAASKSAANWCIASIAISALVMTGYFGILLFAPLAFFL